MVQVLANTPYLTNAHTYNLMIRSSFIEVRTMESTRLQCLFSKY